MRTNHVVPTHLRTPETILTFGSLNLSVRQFLLLLLGTALSYSFWLHLKAFAALPGGQLLRLLCALIPALLAVAFAFVRLAGRSLDRWILVFLHFQQRPKRLVWRSVRFQESDGASGLVPQEESHG